MVIVYYDNDCKVRRLCEFRYEFPDIFNNFRPLLSHYLFVVYEKSTTNIYKNLICSEYYHNESKITCISIIRLMAFVGI